MPTLNDADRVSNLQQNAVLLSVKRGRLRTRRRISSNAVQSDADPGVLYVAKEILESKELDAINQHDAQIGNYLSKICLPGPFKAGMYLLPVRLIEPTIKRLDEAARERDVMVEDFMAWYERAYRYAQADEELAAALVAEDAAYAEFKAWRDRLGSLWTPSDFPTPQQVREKFVFDVQVLELQTPGKLKAISKELYQRELAKMQNVWEGASEKITSVLMEEFQKLTAHMAERLTADQDGKPKVFRDSLVKNMVEWFDLFDARNLANDEQLKALVERARRTILGIDVETIRDSEGLRADLSKEFQAITAELDRAIIERPARKLDLED